MSNDLMRWIGAILCGLAWFALVVMKMAPVDSFVIFLSSAIGALMGHGASVWATASPPGDEGPKGGKLFWANPPPNLPVPPVSANRQGGWTTIRTMMWLMVLAVTLVFVCGCAAVPQPIIDAKHASDDNAVTNIKLGLCNLPVGTVIRHQEIQAFVMEVCRP